MKKLVICFLLILALVGVYAGQATARPASQADARSLRFHTGDSVPDFTLADSKGDSVSLSDFRGRYTLVDFWASWCRDCRKENPAVVELYKVYGDSVAVVSVSIDSDKEAWLKAVEHDGLSWTQLNDPSGWNEGVAKVYGIRWIPTTYLLDPDGRVVAGGSEISGVAAALETLFKKQ